MFDNNYIFLHGWGVSYSIWEELAEVFGENNKASTPCLYDIASKSKDYAFESLAEQIAETSEPETIVVAWSLGGFVATCLVEKTKNIKAVIFIASAPCFINKKGWSNVIDKKNIDGLQESLTKDTRSTLEYFAGLVAHGDSTMKQTNKKIRSNLADEKHSEKLFSWLTQMKETDQRKDFSDLSVPSLIILGENDSLINSKIEGELKQLNPNVQTTVVNNSCHAPFISKQNEVVKKINTFVDTVFHG